MVQWKKVRKGISPLFAGVLYFAIAIAGVTIVVQTGAPALANMKDVAAIDQAKDSLSNLDKIISLVAEEGRGSSRVVPLQIKRGDFVFSADLDTIAYEIDTKADVISPGTQNQVGALIFSSGSSVNVYDNGASWILENEHLRVNLTMAGNSSSYASLNTSGLIEGIYFKDTETPFDGTVEILIDELAAAGIGNGYTYAEEIGLNIARGRVIAHMNTTTAFYDVYFTLQSGSDFIDISVRNFNTY